MYLNVESTRVTYDSFRQEYHRGVNPNALKKDLLSYLGEYRFHIQEYCYDLLFAFSGGQTYLLDVDDKEPIVNKATRAVHRRIKEGKNSGREEAELKGLMRLEDQLKNAVTGDQIIWASPPGLKAEGYGNYGFFYVGRIDQVDPLSQKKHISMKAIRIESPTFFQYNNAFSFLSGNEYKFNRAEQFLASPLVIPRLEQNIEEIIYDLFNLKSNNEKDQMFKKVFPLLSASFDEFVTFVKQSYPKKLLYKALQSIELAALDLIEQFTRQPNNLSFCQSTNLLPLEMMMIFYSDRKPPPVSGSCGSTKTTSNDNLPDYGLPETNNIFSNFSSLREILTLNNNDYKNDPNLCQCGNPNEAHFHCLGNNKQCKHPIIVGERTIKCPECGAEAVCK